MGDASRQQQRTAEPFADLTDERKRRQRTRVPASPGGDSNQTISALLNGLVGKAVVDDIVQHNAAIGMDGLIDVFACTQRGDDNRHLVVHNNAEVVLNAVIGAVHDEVRGKRAYRSAGVVLRELGIGFADLVKPVRQRLLGAGVESGERADDSRLALSLDELGARCDEHGGCHDRQAQISAQLFGKFGAFDSHEAPSI